MHAHRCVYANTLRADFNVLLCFKPQNNLDNSHVCVCCVCACVLCVSVCQCHLLNSRAEILPYFFLLFFGFRFVFVLIFFLENLFELVIPKVSSFAFFSFLFL